VPLDCDFGSWALHKDKDKSKHNRDLIIMILNYRLFLERRGRRIDVLLEPSSLPPQRLAFINSIRYTAQVISHYYLSLNMT
jgi:hypothetical protein